MPKISVVIPSYLEAENLKILLPKIKENLKDITYEIIVVDSIEPMDNSKEICESYGVRYINRTKGNFYGDAIRTGFQNSLGEYTVVMDADGSHDPKEIIEFYKKMEANDIDLVIGSRYCLGGKTDNNCILIFMSWILNITYRLAFGLNVKDVSDSYRMYKTDQIKNIYLECINFDIVEEILIKLVLQYDNFKIIELPITFNKRFAGKSKRNLWKFVLTYISTIIRLMRIRLNYKRKKI